MKSNRPTDQVDIKQKEEEPTNPDTRRREDIQHEAQVIRLRHEPTSPSLPQGQQLRTNAVERTRPSAALAVPPFPVMAADPQPIEAQPPLRPQLVGHNQPLPEEHPQQQFVMPPSPPLSPPGQEEANQVNENEINVDQQEEICIMTKIEEDVNNSPVVQFSSNPDPFADKLYPSSPDSRDRRHQNDRVNRRQSPYDRPNNVQPNNLRPLQPLTPRQNANQVGGDNVNGVDLNQRNFDLLPSASSNFSRPQDSLRVDTRFANEQFARQHAANVARRKRNAQLVWARIQANDYKGLFALLQNTRPDLNVYLDGQTALHQCLLLRKFGLSLTCFYVELIFSFQVVEFLGVVC